MGPEGSEEFKMCSVMAPEGSKRFAVAGWQHAKYRSRDKSAITF
jgi:hypothetical protein